MKQRVTRMVAAALLALIAVPAVAGCSQEKRGTADAPVSGHRGDDSPASVTNFPDHYANIATKCVAGAPGFRAFVTTRDAAPTIMADASCKG
jgi:hypothetical protein